jgi:hypothetical protein
MGRGLGIVLILSIKLLLGWELPSGDWTDFGDSQIFGVAFGVGSWDWELWDSYFSGEPIGRCPCLLRLMKDDLPPFAIMILFFVIWES